MLKQYNSSSAAGMVRVVAVKFGMIISLCTPADATTRIPAAGNEADKDVIFFAKGARAVLV